MPRESGELSTIASRRNFSQQYISTRDTEEDLVSIDNIVDNFIREQAVYIDAAQGDNDHISMQVHHSETSSNSIPKRLRSFYSHASFRQIILSILSLLSIASAFIGLFAGLLEPCETLGFTTSIILLFAPSPLCQTR